jgi:hypothetical protein
MRAGLVGATVLATAGVAAGAHTRSPALDGATIANYSTPTHRSTSPRTPAESTVAPPTAASPGPGAVLSEGPLLSWHLTGALDGARVELSPSADFDDAVTVRYDVRGGELGVPAVPGVWYWRLRGRSEGTIGDRPGPARSFSVIRELPTRRRDHASGDPDEPDWGYPFDLLLRGIALGPTRDMR